MRETPSPVPEDAENGSGGLSGDCEGGYSCRAGEHIEGCLSGDHGHRLASLILGEAPTITNWSDACALADAILAAGWTPPAEAWGYRPFDGEIVETTKEDAVDLTSRDVLTQLMRRVGGEWREVSR